MNAIFLTRRLRNNKEQLLCIHTDSPQKKVSFSQNFYLSSLNDLEVKTVIIYLI